MIDKTLYPDVDFPWDPCGSFVLVQVEKPLTKIGSILLTDESRDEKLYMKSEGVVRGVGPVAYRYRSTGESWEGEHPQPGDKVAFPMYGGAPYWANEYDEKNKVKFLLFKDNEVLMRGRR